VTVTAHTHADGHSHSHDGHPHEGHGPGQGHEAGLPPAGGPVALDIGGDVGALIARVGAERLGSEIHVRRHGDTHTTHTGVWERDLGGERVVVAVYPALVEGVYDVLGGHGETVAEVAITGAEVTETDWR
jgi:hypothetical protein